MLVLDFAAGLLDIQKRLVHEEESLEPGLPVVEFLMDGGKDFLHGLDAGFRDFQGAGVAFDGARQDHGQADQGPVRPRPDKRQLPFVPPVAGLEQLLQGNLHGSVHDVVDLVQHLAVAVHDDAHDAVAERKRIGVPDDAAGLGGEVVDIHEFHPRRGQPFDDPRALRVHGDAVFGHDDIDPLAGRDEGCHLRDDARDPAAQERADDDAEGAVLGRIRVAADSAADDAVGPDEDIDVEVDIDLQGRQDHDIQGMDGGTDVVRARILDGGNLLVELVMGDGFGRDLVEGLDVHESADEAFLVELHHVGGDAAEGEGGLDSLLQHALADVLDGREGCAAGTGLDAESILEITAVDDHLGSLFRQQDVPRVLAVPDGAGRDLGTVAHGLHHDHGVHVAGGDGLGNVRIRDQVVRQDDDVVGVARVGKGVAQGAADGFCVFRARASGGVAQFVAGGSGKEGHVDVQRTGGDGAAAPAVRAEHDRFLHQAMGYLVGQFPPEAGSGNPRDDTVADMLDQGRVHVGKAGSREMQVPEAHFGQLGDHHVHDPVAAAEMMMERDGHPVLQARSQDGFLEAHDFRMSHNASSLSKMPDATARATVRSARITTGRSTILPFREMTPEPLAWASLMAAMMRSAFSISRGDGANTSFTTSIWRGLMMDFPSKPRVLMSSTSFRKVSMSSRLE